MSDSKVILPTANNNYTSTDTTNHTSGSTTQEEQDMEATNAKQPSLFEAFLPIILIFGVMYFLLIRPQKKKEKEHKAMTDSLKHGMKVVTIGGIHGKVVKIEEEAVYVEIAEGMKIKCERHAISRVIQSSKNTHNGAKDRNKTENKKNHKDSKESENSNTELSHKHKKESDESSLNTE